MFEVEVTNEDGELEKYTKESLYDVLKLFKKLDKERITSIIIRRGNMKPADRLT